MLYCEECGNKNKESSKFCVNCGKPINSSNEKEIKDEKPLFIIKQVFIPVIKIISHIPFLIFITIWATGFLGFFGSKYIKEVVKLKIPGWSIFLIIGIIFFVGTPLITILIQRKTYAKTKYIFYPGKMEYSEGFFTIEEKTISYERIAELYLRKNVLQKMYGLGTIVLSTPATGSIRGRARSGIRLADIKNPDEVYKKIKNIIK